jgi:peptidoglycan-associated lipoprotein
MHARLSTLPSPSRLSIGRLSAWLMGLLFASGVVLTGCGPTYPNCSSDDHCKAKGEFCVDSKCAQCRVDANCPGAGTDQCVACVKGACGRKPDCCSTKLDCGNGKKCEGGKCMAECAADADCPNGGKCTNGGCVAAGGVTEGAGCKTDGDCGKGLKCQGGKCMDEKGECSLADVHFDFNEAALTSQAQDTLSADAKCMKEKKIASLLIEGHTDEKGTDAYNMELGNRRAKAVREYLQHLFPKLKAKTVSYGKTKPVCSEESESCQGQNRRAEFKAK